MADSVENSVPALAVTAAVGAVVLLLILLCSVGRRADKKDEDGNRQHTFNHISCALCNDNDRNCVFLHKINFKIETTIKSGNI